VDESDIKRRDIKRLFRAGKAENQRVSADVQISLFSGGEMLE
jgi:hypothetical protein